MMNKTYILPSFTLLKNNCKNYHKETKCCKINCKECDEHNCFLLKIKEDIFEDDLK